MIHTPSGTPMLPDPQDDDGPVCEACDDTYLVECPWCHDNGTGCNWCETGKICCEVCPPCPHCGNLASQGDHRQCHKIP